MDLLYHRPAGNVDVELPTACSMRENRGAIAQSGDMSLRMDAR